MCSQHTSERTKTLTQERFIAKQPAQERLEAKRRAAREFERRKSQKDFEQREKEISECREQLKTMHKNDAPLEDLEKLIIHMYVLSMKNERVKKFNAKK